MPLRFNFFNRNNTPNEPITEESNSNEISHEEGVKVLLSHPAIEELRDWSEYRCRVLDINDQVKKRMAECYLSTLFKKVRELIIYVINHYEDFTDDTIKLNNLIIDAINDVKSESISNGVPPIFLDRFTNYLYKQARILSLSFKDLDKFQYYKNPITKATFRLDLGFMLIRCVTCELEDLINGMNGELHSALEGSVFDR